MSGKTESRRDGIRSYWEMTNNQGYSDGFQIKFQNNAVRSYPCVQLEIIASSLNTFLMVPVCPCPKVLDNAPNPEQGVEK
ncbi:MAG: hypothetical protein LBH00_04770 [Planctomycetaceae bacterium]|nr:hypothetical protein [Planctomycetaceae bacterium]